jgi:DNA-binding NtrC family response regulator
MRHDILSLQLLIVSEAAPERELVRQAAMQASVMIDVAELGAAGERAETADLLAKQNYDAVFFDSRLPKPVRMGLLALIREARSRPLAVLIGPAAIKTREVFTEGLDVDSALAKPIEMREVRVLMERCIRARLPKRVLIVDDSSTVRAVVSKVMQASRFRLETVEAEDGSAAIALTERKPFDIVFLDCQMPGLDGFATFTELQRVQPDIKVVMMTGARDVRMEDRAREQGAREFLYKPFFAKDIDAVLNRLFDLARP